MRLSEIYYRLSKFNKKHNLHVEINTRYDGTVEFTIYDRDNDNNFIYFYDFDSCELRIKKLHKCLKLLNNKSKALAFISQQGY